MPNLSKRRQDPALIALGNAIREVRKMSGISQEALALLAGVDRSYVGRVERGDNNVAVLTLIRIASAMGMSAAEILKIAKV